MLILIVSHLFVLVLVPKESRVLLCAIFSNSTDHYFLTERRKCTKNSEVIVPL